MNAYDFRKSKFGVAVLPMGSTENHGDHLPFGSDSYEASAIAQDLARELPDLLVLPTLHFGMSEHYSFFPIALSLKSSTLTSVIWDIMASLHKHGIKRLLIINGHDGNIPPIDTAVREFKVAHRDMKVAVVEAWWEIVRQLVPKGTFEAWGGFGHGGEIETSMMLSLREDLVRMEYAKGVIPSLPERVQIKWLFDEITSTGSTGDPGKGTRAKGDLARKILIQHLVGFLKEMEQIDWKYEST